ncbi:cell division protein ZapD [Aquisalimonas sp.]|uniref:cell division protein ZapD n=1 Tax=unclassified Aquisalimonas TaxID=2644645 RepID=UPI0025BE619B|nr:cell division protein ZapD [Aquisalimonas sp.]
MEHEQDHDESIVFEQPLNERVRTLMRLEHLFGQARFAMEGDTLWHSRLGVSTIGEILDLFSRGDLKTELIKELDRVTSLLRRLEERPGVDTDRLHHVIERCGTLHERLGQHTGQLGAALRQDDLLSNVMQRAGIAGGTCAFDLPRYHRWLSRPASARQHDLENWYASIDTVRDATETVLGLLRDSAIPKECHSRKGTYQRNLDKNTSYQLVRVELPADSSEYPEISGTKMFITIRFMEQNGTLDRPQQSTEDKRFVLQLCVL